MKRAPPASLTKYRAFRDATYDGFPDKQRLRECLVAEQRGLCCYCLKRISADAMKIEHWRSQSSDPGRQLDYSNLLGACLGNQGQPRRDHHCDTFKGNKSLSRNPSDSNDKVEDVIHFHSNGEIFSDDQAFHAEINQVLNLNQQFLKDQRRATLDAFKEALPKTGTLKRAQIQRWLRQWNGDATNSYLNPYCQVIVYWLRKKLGRP